MRNDPSQIFIRDFTYLLPIDRIAEFPLELRDQSKLLIYKGGNITETVFDQLADQMTSSANLVLNNTRVIEARILFQKKTGGVIEIFCLEPQGKFRSATEAMSLTGKATWNCLIGGASKWKPGQILEKEVTVENRKLVLTAKYLGKKEDSFLIEFEWDSYFSFAEVLHAAGAIPLPPYIKRKAENLDTERYQTIFAEQQGSVAAPTAALHFTQSVFETLRQKDIEPIYVTLHVGAGTFKPVKTETIAEHQMHAEHFEVSIESLNRLVQQKDIIAVGTTSLRTLESLYWVGLKIKYGIISSLDGVSLGQWEAYELQADSISYRESIQAIIDLLKKEDANKIFCLTSLLIMPGYQFRSAKALITNFHQPQSTLLLLVAAFIGDDWKKVYDYALENNFRFLSYGDSSLLWRKD